MPKGRPHQNEDAARRTISNARKFADSPPLPTSQDAPKAAPAKKWSASLDPLTAAFAMLDRRIDRRRRPRRFLPIGNAFSIVRLREIERFLSWRYGPILPDDDAGRDDLRLLLAATKLAGKDAMG